MIKVVTTALCAFSLSLSFASAASGTSVPEFTAIRLTSRYLAERQMIDVVLADVPAAQKRYDAALRTLQLAGGIDVHFDDLPKNREYEDALELARRLAGFGRKDQGRLDLTNAQFRLLVNDDVFELERVGGGGSRHTEQNYVRLKPARGASSDSVWREIWHAFHEAREPGTPRETYRLVRSIFFDLRDLEPDQQGRVTAYLRDALAAHSIAGKTLRSNQVAIHVQRRTKREDERAVPLTPAPPALAYIDFVRNPRFRLGDHLTYFTRKAPLSHLEVGEDGVTRFRGILILRDDALPNPERRALRDALIEVLSGRRSIAGARFDDSGQQVKWQVRVPTCNEDLERRLR